MSGSGKAAPLSLNVRGTYLAFDLLTTGITRVIDFRTCPSIGHDLSQTDPDVVCNNLSEPLGLVVFAQPRKGEYPTGCSV